MWGSRIHSIGWFDKMPKKNKTSANKRDENEIENWWKQHRYSWGSAGSAEPSVNRPACSCRENITLLIRRKANTSESFRFARPRPLTKGQQQTNAQHSNNNEKQLPSKWIISSLNKLSNPCEENDRRWAACCWGRCFDRLTLSSHSFSHITSFRPMLRPPVVNWSGHFSKLTFQLCDRRRKSDSFSWIRQKIQSQVRHRE